MEYGNYMMIVTADNTGTLDHKYSEIKSAYDQGIIVALKFGMSDQYYLAFLMNLDESTENTYSVGFKGMSEGAEYFTAETEDGYPVYDN